MRALDFTVEEVEEAKTTGVDLEEESGEEDVGGYASEMMYLRHRYSPEPHAMGDELEAFYAAVIEPKVERLEAMLNPSSEDHAAYRFALKIQEDFRRHGPPNTGGRRDQPAWWLYVIDAIEGTVERAESAKQREEAAVNRSKE